MAIKGQSFGNLDDKRELQDKAPAPEGYHCVAIINELFLQIWGLNYT